MRVCSPQLGAAGSAIASSCSSREKPMRECDRASKVAGMGRAAEFVSDRSQWRLAPRHPLAAVAAARP
jgi:hypothetical protein